MIIFILKCVPPFHNFFILFSEYSFLNVDIWIFTIIISTEDIHRFVSMNREDM